MWHNGKQQDAKYFGVMILAFMFSGLVALAVADQIGPTTDPGWLPDIKGAGFIPAFAASFLVILVSEIGDKTFFIAAILSMKNNFLVVFAGAIGALSVMTVLSAGLGTLPHLRTCYFPRCFVTKPIIPGDHPLFLHSPICIIWRASPA